MKFCWALWNYVCNVVSLHYVRQVGWTLARRNPQAVLRWVNLPTFSIIDLIITSICVLFRSNMADVDELISFELGRHVSDIISLIEWNTCQCDFRQFRLDWLYNAVVGYCDNMGICFLSGRTFLNSNNVSTNPATLSLKWLRRLHLNMQMICFESNSLASYAKQTTFLFFGLKPVGKFL